MIKETDGVLHIKINICQEIEEIKKKYKLEEDDDITINYSVGLR